jgi:tripartite-type tricarboxylate transporter receptor subunit TctC
MLSNAGGPPREGEAMRRAAGTGLVGVMAGLALVAQAQSAGAQATVESFYKGRTVSILVATSPGGRYDVNARLIANHIGPFIPGKPTVVVQNTPGGGGLVLANRLYNTSARDGATLAVIQPGTPQVAIQGAPNAKFDPLKFTWLGSLSSFGEDADMLVLTPRHRAQSALDLRKPGVGATLGAGAPGSTNLIFAQMAKDVLGLNVRIVRGYPGAPALSLGMQSGEVDGQVVLLSSMKATQRALWDAKGVRPIVQFGRRDRLKELADIPTGHELVETPDGDAMLDFAELPFYMSLPLLAPPDIPDDRRQALAAAFMAMTKDPGFVAEATKLEIDLSPIDGDKVLELLRKAAATPKDVIARYNKIVPVAR